MDGWINPAGRGFLTDRGWEAMGFGDIQNLRPSMRDGGYLDTIQIKLLSLQL